MIFVPCVTVLLEVVQKLPSPHIQFEAFVLDDREFIERLRAEDVAAVRHLSECLLPSLWRFVYFRVKGDQHLAEDIVSESVLSLIKTVAAADVNVVCPGAWMRSVATHKILDHFRAVARVQHLIDQADSLISQNQPAQPACEAEAACEVEERRAAIRKVLDDLPEPHRQALEWKYVDHLSVQEIAGRMAMTEKSVESILYRARREFREGLGVLNRDEVPFRLNGKSRQANDNGQTNEHGRAAVSGFIPRDPLAEVMANHPADLDEEKRQS